MRRKDGRVRTGTRPRLLVLVLVLALVSCGSQDPDDSQGSAGNGGAGASGAAGTATTAGSGGAGGVSSGTTAGSGGAGGSAGQAGTSGASGAGNSSGSGGSTAGQSGSAAAGAGAGGSTSSDAGTPAPLPPLAESVCPAGASYAPPTPGTRTAALVQGGFHFLEGPVWIASLGVLLFSDMDFGGDMGSGPPSRIHRLMPPSSVDVFVEQGNSNGLALIPEGYPTLSVHEAVLGCVHDARTLAVIEPNGARSPLGFKFDGKQFNSPNDLTLRSDGTVYFTDPDWQLAGRPAQIGFTGVFRVVPQTSFDAALVTDALDKPNGITLSLDERTLYVGSAGSDILAFPVADDGSTGDPSVFASPGGSDGMGIDCAGNLYVTSGGQVKVFSPDGDALYQIDVAETPSNVAFGGDDLHTLYITAGTGLYSIELEIPGLPY